MEGTRKRLFCAETGLINKRRKVLADRPWVLTVASESVGNVPVYTCADRHRVLTVASVSIYLS